MCIFSTLIIWEITLQSLDLIWAINFVPLSLPLPPSIFSYLQALIHVFLWWWACSWLIFSLKWCLQSPSLLLHSAAIDLQEAKDSIDKQDPRPTSYTWSYIMWYQEHLHLGDVLLLHVSLVWSIHFNFLFFIVFSMYVFHCLVVWCCLE